MTSRARIVALASALLVSQAGLALAQSAPGSPGTAGAANAGAASGSLGGGTPTQPGTAPGTTNPGNINVPPPPAASSAPTASPNQVPSGTTVQSTTPPRTQAPVAGGGGRTVGQSNRADADEIDEADPRKSPIVQESEREVSKRIKSICRGC